MRDRREDRMPDALEGVARQLREDRPQLGALDLDKMKTRVLARAGARQPKGAALRGRIVVAMLALGLMGAGAGGVVAAGGGSANSNQSADGQYQPAKCHTDKAGNTKGCECPDHSVLVSNNGRFECQCPDGSSFSGKGNSCKCPAGEKFDNKTDSCVTKGGKGGPPPHGGPKDGGPGNDSNDGGPGNDSNDGSPGKGPKNGGPGNGPNNGGPGPQGGKGK
jgi:hypothetical protein